jgi:hypothetical protein
VAHTPALRTALAAVATLQTAEPGMTGRVMATLSAVLLGGLAAGGPIASAAIALGGPLSHSAPSRRWSPPPRSTVSRRFGSLRCRHRGDHDSTIA